PQGYEYPAVGSRLMRLIRDDLAGKAGYARSVAVLNLAGTFGELQKRGVRVAGADPAVELRYNWPLYFVVTFRLLVTGPAPADETVRVVLDAAGRALLPEATVRFAEFEPLLVDVTQVGGEYAGAAARRGSGESVENALQQAREAAE